MPNPKPITIAVCTYRRFEQLSKCLASIKQLSISPDQYDLLVIDNSLTPEASRAYRDSIVGFNNLFYVITEKCGIAYARNKALENCNTELIAFTDDDCIVYSDWLEKILALFKYHSKTVAVVGGRVIPQWNVKRPAWLDGEFLNSLAVLDWGDDEQFIDPLKGKWLLTANSAYRTTALKKAGGFAEHLGRKRNIPMAQEEFAANLELFKSGYDLLYSPEIVVEHSIGKERMTQKWQCYDAFWYAVSSELMSSNGVSMQIVENALDSLSPEIDSLLMNWKEDLAYSDLSDKVALFRNKGHQAAKKYFPNSSKNSVTKGRNNIYQSWPVIYVATPVLNAVNTIDRCIMSVVSQVGNFCIRYHIQDGGSTDGTVNKLIEWEQLLKDSKSISQCRNIVFSWESKKDKGMYSAIHRGFENMSIPDQAYMTWINADDILMPGALAMVTKISYEFPETVHWLCGYTAKFKNDHLIMMKPRFLNKGLIQRGLHDGEHLDYLQQEGTFFKKWLWNKCNKDLDAYLYAGDWNLWRNFADYAHIYQVPFPLGCFTIRSNQMSHEKKAAYQDEIDKTVPRTVRKEAYKQLRFRHRYFAGKITIDRDNGHMQAKIHRYGNLIDSFSEKVNTLGIRLKTWLAKILPDYIKKPLKIILYKSSKY